MGVASGLRARQGKAQRSTSKCRRRSRLRTQSTELKKSLCVTKFPVHTCRARLWLHRDLLRCWRRLWYYRNGNGLADSEGDRRFTGNFDADRETLGKSDPIYGLVNCSE